MRTFRRVGGSSRQYKKWADWGEGDAVIGKYLGSGERESQFGLQTYHDIDPMEVDTDGVSLDKTLRLNSCGSIDNQMDEVAEGSIVKVTFNGKGIIESGPMKGKEFNDVTVEVAEEDDTDGL
jgi:hypothetical protein